MSANGYGGEVGTNCAASHLKLSLIIAFAAFQC